MKRTRKPVKLTLNAQRIRELSKASLEKAAGGTDTYTFYDCPVAKPATHLADD